MLECISLLRDGAFESGNIFGLKFSYSSPTGHSTLHGKERIILRKRCPDSNRWIVLTFKSLSQFKDPHRLLKRYFIRHLLHGMVVWWLRRFWDHPYPQVTVLLLGPGTILGWHRLLQELLMSFHASCILIVIFPTCHCQSAKSIESKQPFQLPSEGFFVFSSLLLQEPHLALYLRGPSGILLKPPLTCVFHEIQVRLPRFQVLSRILCQELFYFWFHILNTKRKGANLRFLLLGLGEITPIKLFTIFACI